MSTPGTPRVDRPDADAVPRLAAASDTADSRWHVGDLAWHPADTAGRGLGDRTFVWERDDDRRGAGCSLCPGGIASRAAGSTGSSRGSSTRQACCRASWITRSPCWSRPWPPWTSSCSPSSGTRRQPSHGWTCTGPSGPIRPSLTQTWPYDPRFDLVAVSADGILIGYVVRWFPPGASTGQFEPVGTLPGWRRRGISRVLGHRVLTVFADAGATHALVYAGEDDGYAAARAAYELMGFTGHARQNRWQRPMG